MILDFSSRPDEARLYEVLDAATGEVIDDLIFYADDERGYYRRHLTYPTGGIQYDVVLEGAAREEVHRPIRIVPRLERLCVSLRASLAEQGVSADDIPEPVLGALALLRERLERLERRVAEALTHLLLTGPRPEPTPEEVEELRRLVRENRGRPYVIAPEPALETVTTPEADRFPIPSGPGRLGL